VEKGEQFSDRDNIVFILLLDSGSGSAGYTDDLCNSQ
jgi:hypothetical protein